MTNEKAIEYLKIDTMVYNDGTPEGELRKIVYNTAISALEHDRWIPFKLIEGTNMLQEPIPKDGQKILISVNIEGHEPVQHDIFYYDTGECYLDSNYEIIEDVPAWRPLPEPYRESEGEHETD